MRGLEPLPPGPCVLRIETSTSTAETLGGWRRQNSAARSGLQRNFLSREYAAVEPVILGYCGWLVPDRATWPARLITGG